MPTAAIAFQTFRRELTVIETSVSGFAPAKADDIVVEVGQATTVDLPLTLGTATAEVEVTAEAPVINTNDNANSTNINQTSISELPINGRRASNFVLLTPSTVPDGTFGLISFRGISGVLNNSTGRRRRQQPGVAVGRTRPNAYRVRGQPVGDSRISGEHVELFGGVRPFGRRRYQHRYQERHERVSRRAFSSFTATTSFGARNPLAFKSFSNPDFTTLGCV